MAGTLQFHKLLFRPGYSLLYIKHRKHALKYFIETLILVTFTVVYQGQSDEDCAKQQSNRKHSLSFLEKNVVEPLEIGPCKS